MMLKSPFIFLASVLIFSLSPASAAKAKEDAIGLTFDLPPVKTKVKTTVKTNVSTQEHITPTVAVEETQLEKPQETLPPLLSSDNALTQTAAANQQDIGVHFLESSITLLSKNASERAPEWAPEQTSEQLPLSRNQADPLQALSFGADLLETYGAKPEEREEGAFIANKNRSTDVAYDALGLDDWIYEGGARSLVAHTVGSAEGTRRWNGDKTQAYYGHKDPGNGVWNLGTFSYQHEATTPEEADEKQIRRLKSQGFQLEDQAVQQGLKLSLVEKLNGLDLANQAPLAALGEGGYVERLAQANRLGMKEEEAIAWARTRAYIDPNTQAWNAPGLGNNLYSISKDQERRMSAINKALKAYEMTGEERPAGIDYVKNVVEHKPVDFALPPAITENVESVEDWVDPIAAEPIEPSRAVGETAEAAPSLAELLPEHIAEDAPTLDQLLEQKDVAPGNIGRAEEYDQAIAPETKPAAEKPVAKLPLAAGRK